MIETGSRKRRGRQSPAAYLDAKHLRAVSDGRVIRPRTRHRLARLGWLDRRTNLLTAAGKARLTAITERHFRH